jgi:hypothetical protein
MIISFVVITVDQSVSSSYRCVEYNMDAVTGRALLETEMDHVQGSIYASKQHCLTLATFVPYSDIPSQNRFFAPFTMIAVAVGMLYLPEHRIRGYNLLKFAHYQTILYSPRL